jgi:hypothetical protein
MRFLRIAAFLVIALASGAQVLLLENFREAAVSGALATDNAAPHQELVYQSLAIAGLIVSLALLLLATRRR